MVSNRRVEVAHVISDGAFFRMISSMEGTTMGGGGGGGGGSCSTAGEGAADVFAEADAESDLRSESPSYCGLLDLGGRSRSRRRLGIRSSPVVESLSRELGRIDVLSRELGRLDVLSREFGRIDVLSRELGREDVADDLLR